MKMAANRRADFFVLQLGLIFLILSLPSLAAGADGQNLSASNAFAAKVTELWQQLPPAQTHVAGLPDSERQGRQRREENYQALLREKMEDRWFAALLSVGATDALSVQRRFESWKELVEFLAER